MLKVFGYLTGKIVLKLSPMIRKGMSFEQVGAYRLLTDDDMWVQSLPKYQESVLKMMDMENCKPPTSPKLDKANEEGYIDKIDAEQASLYRSAVLTILYFSRRRPDLQATTRWMCKRFQQPDRTSWRQLKKVCRYLVHSSDLATFFPAEGISDTIDGYLDGDWGCDDLDRKSVSGGFLKCGGCRLHSHSRTTQQHALSSGESEIMAMSELLKEALLFQYNLMFVGYGELRVVMHTDADVARSFVHKRGVGRMKHLDVRLCWLQDRLEKMVYQVKRVDRAFNASDMLTHSPNSDELKRFNPLVCLFPMMLARGVYELVKTVLQEQPGKKVMVAALLSQLLPMAEGVEPVDDESKFVMSYPMLVASFFVFGLVLVIYVGSCFCRSKKEEEKTKKMHIIACPDTVAISKNGECFHRTSECRALAGIASHNKRKCSFCCKTELWEFVGGAGEDEFPTFVKMPISKPKLG